jgi:hypothetical protein
MPIQVDKIELAKEIAALDTFLNRTRGDRDRRMACMALGARAALEWIRVSPKAQPMNPMRTIELLACALDLLPPAGAPVLEDAPATDVVDAGSASREGSD